MSRTIWRISQKKQAPRAFSGEGCRRRGGRWHSQGMKIVYASATLSLAALETFFPMEIIDARDLYVAIAIELPDDLQIERVDKTKLPANWRATFAPSILTKIGLEWYQARRSAVLIVPSAIIPVESNYLINPQHKDFARIRIYPPQPFLLV
ncbi:RES family NAD+ phosphorylase [Oscillatoria salina]|uniref:RES family NAD+ phosphorylase n=1 Tax=Oscillatoria salina TaxID=331517 RepID=UPI0013B8DF96|nr:RES family NAD+ phosphorylase [Oscillatoria salina]MBZ8182377.1 RES domain-containing protein [Oscillatoria salina IIICB1]NET90154.1 RES domain-containing protein [Kamptonema sp. SIO1D9]